jgi:hypothetical protein
MRLINIDICPYVVAEMILSRYYGRDFVYWGNAHWPEQVRLF